MRVEFPQDGIIRLFAETKAENAVIIAIGELVCAAGVDDEICNDGGCCLPDGAEHGDELNFQTIPAADMSWIGEADRV